MSKIESFKLFESAVNLFHKTIIQKLISSPGRFIYSKILESITKVSRKTIKIRAKTFWGENMILVIPEQVSITISRYGFFEEGLTRMLLTYLKPGMIFFDIGSHFGYFTLLASHIIGNNGKVCAFEPTPSTFDILKTNTLKLKNAVLNNLAIYSAKKLLTINDFGIEYSAYNSIYGARLPEKTISRLKAKKYQIEAISIDEYVESTGIKPHFIKIDAESSDYQVLLGMEKTIEKLYPIITVEVGDCKREGVPSSKELITFLEKKGYQPYEYNKGDIKKHIVKDGPYIYDNILFLPKR
jgi:FkbM family methyltransferase